MSKKKKEVPKKPEKEDLSYSLEVWDVEGHRRIFKFDEKGDMI